MQTVLQNRSQSLSRALDLIEMIGRSENGLGLQEVSEALEISPPAAFQLAKTLSRRGYLEKSAKPIRYRLGGMFYELTRHGAQREILRVTGEAIRALARDFPEITVIVVEASGGNLITRLRMDPSRPGWLQQPDNLVHPYGMITAACAFAFLGGEDAAAVRARYPFDEFSPPELKSWQEFEEVLTCIRKKGHIALAEPRFRVTAPLFGRGGALWGSVGASLPEEVRFSKGRQNELVAALRRMAEDISEN